MSGYLEIKNPFKSNLGLNPFKSWKRQWCILRPSPTCAGASLAVYCSEAGASAGTVELPSGCFVKRAKSRTRPYAFAVFSEDEPRKPRVLLAAQSLHEAQLWMEKIRALLNGSKILEKEPVLKDSYSVNVITTELSRRCGLPSDVVVTLSGTGALLARAHRTVLLEWTHVTDVLLDEQNVCVLFVDSKFHGGGELRLCSPRASELARVLCARTARRRARSDTDLRTATSTHTNHDDERRTSWYSGPSEVSLDDIDLVMSKECVRMSGRQLLRYSGAALAPADPPDNDSMSDRRSVLSVASGIYEEIPELPATVGRDGEVLLTELTKDLPDRLLKCEEPMYECVESLFATMRRRPPPLPPRRHNSESGHVTRHSSLGSLPRTHSLGAHTLPNRDKRQPFSVFRKRLKSDSRILSSKTEPSKDKDTDTKKKKFDFTPTRDIFKSFKVSRKKNIKLTNTNLTKGETKSCEFLDTEHIQTNRCSKSVECLENFEFEADLSIEFGDSVDVALSLPQQIVDLILNHEQLNKVRLKEAVEGDYMPMSPIIPPPVEHHYIVMSPRTNAV